MRRLRQIEEPRHHIDDLLFCRLTVTDNRLLDLKWCELSDRHIILRRRQQYHTTRLSNRYRCRYVPVTIILETESVESAANDEETFIRNRRIAFYKKSGCVDTGCMYNVFGVEYNVFINKDIELTEDFLAKLLSAYEYAYAAILRRDDKDYIYRVK